MARYQSLRLSMLQLTSRTATRHASISSSASSNRQALMTYITRSSNIIPADSSRKHLESSSRRGLSSFVGGHNPMFPERAIPDVDVDSSSKSRANKDDDDFLSRHGGKVALVGFGLSAWLIYRWFRNNSDRNEAESHMRMEYALSPTDISEMRHRNSISSDAYRGLIGAALSEFQCAGLRSDAARDDIQSISTSSKDGGDIAYNGVEVSYRDFIAFVKKHLGTEKLAYAHHLDRVVLRYIENKQKQVALSANTTTSSNTDGDVSVPSVDGDVKVPLPFLLVAFSMTVAARHSIRLGDMFYLCQQLDAIDSDSGASADTPSSSTTSITTATSTSATASSTAGGCSVDAFLLTLQFLSDSCQIPAEKRVVADASRSWPYQMHTVKTTRDMMSEAVEVLDAVPFGLFSPSTWPDKAIDVYHRWTTTTSSSNSTSSGGSKVSEARVKQLLESTVICAWGSCYGSTSTSSGSSSSSSS